MPIYGPPSLSVDGPQGAPGLVWRGVYSGATTYATNDAVQYNGGAFIATAGTTGVAPGTTASPTAPWQLVAVGPTGATGPAGAGASGALSPADLGFKAWVADPGLINPGTRVTPTAGIMTGSLVNLPADTITGVTYFIGVAGATVTNCYIGLIDAATGNRLAVTADLSGTNTGSGLRRVAFASSFTAAGGYAYVTVLVGTAVTMPQFTRLANTDGAFGNARGPGVTAMMRCGQITSASGLTAIPTTNTLAGNSVQAGGLWAGID